MGNVTLWMQVSADGFVEGPNGKFDWPVVQGELHQYFVDELGRADTFLYGRKVYELTAYFWPTADEDPQGSEQASAPPNRTCQLSGCSRRRDTSATASALGGGTPLFGGLDHRLGLELAGTRTFDPGVVQLRYRYSAGDTRL
jgi:hypothetical protein